MRVIVTEAEDSVVHSLPSPLPCQTCYICNLYNDQYMPYNCCIKCIIIYINTVGHGKSEGDRVHINNFRTYCDDVIQHVEDTKAEYPDLPCFLMGHSNVSIN